MELDFLLKGKRTTSVLLPCSRSYTFMISDESFPKAQRLKQLAQGCKDFSGKSWVTLRAAKLLTLDTTLLYTVLSGILKVKIIVS